MLDLTIAARRCTREVSRSDDKTTSNQEILMKITNAILAGSFAVLAALGGASRAQPPQGTVTNIVLVHGAFADGSSWAKVIPILESRGFHVTAVQNPLTSLADDANATRRIIALGWPCHSGGSFLGRSRHYRGR